MSLKLKAVGHARREINDEQLLIRNHCGTRERLEIVSFPAISRIFLQLLCGIVAERVQDMKKLLSFLLPLLALSSHVRSDDGDQCCTQNGNSIGLDVVLLVDVNSASLANQVGGVQPLNAVWAGVVACVFVCLYTEILLCR